VVDEPKSADGRQDRPTAGRQSRLMSLTESIVSVCVGFGLALLIQLIALPWFGVHLSMPENLMLSVIFTSASIARSYVLRRLFEMLRPI
jgi:hypothetical protein